MRVRRVLIVLSCVLLIATLSVVAITILTRNSRWPGADLTARWLGNTQTVAQLTLRGPQTHEPGRGWFRLTAPAGVIMDCSTAEGIRYGKLDPATGQPARTETEPIEAFYCDGSRITGRIDQRSTGVAYGISTVTQPVASRGRYSITGSTTAPSFSAHPQTVLDKTRESPQQSMPEPDRLAWNEEFNGSKQTDLGDWTIANNSTYGSGGRSTNVMRSDDRNVRVENGHLTIQAHREDPSRATLGQPFSSGYLTSDYVLDLSKPGRLDARANPNLTPGRSKGKWPGIWLRNHRSQEFDINEMVGTSHNNAAESNRWQAAAHFDTTHVDKRKRLSVHDFAGSPNDFHVWSTVWDGRGNFWVYCDGTLAVRFDTAEDPWLAGFVGKFQIRIDMFLQGVNPGPVDDDTEFDTGYQVDYLRYYTQ